MARTQQPDYLYRRIGSQNWWLRLQYNGRAAELIGKNALRISLGTPDRKAAELKAAPYIYKHKLTLIAASQGRPVNEFLPDWQAATIQDMPLPADRGGSVSKKKRHSSTLHTKATKPSFDDLIIDTWITQRCISKYLAAEARKVWDIFRKITNYKPLKACGRDDGRKLVTYLAEQGDKMATVKKKVANLNAACNIAITDGKIRLNPFSGVAPNPTDATRRLPLSNDDMKRCRENIALLRQEDQLLWRLLALTGMRLDEAFQIDEEFEENGIRYVIAGTKTDQSRRRVPLPQPLLTILPAKIQGRLFTSSTKAAGKRLRTWLRGLDISHDVKRGTGDARKVPHSLRHRAKDRLRAAGCPLDIQYQLLGHEENTVASGYGVGYPVEVLAKWLPQIGE